MIDDSKVLVMAQFLSTFQHYYQGQEKPLGRSIFKGDIIAAVAFRERVSHHQRQEDQYQRLKHLSPEQQLKWRKSLEESQSRIEDTCVEVQAVHRILLRFEVWSTKALAKKLLLYSKGAKTCSPLLNLPAASHFQRILLPPVAGTEKFKIPEEDNNFATAELPLPPNVWTCHEYLRVSRMLALLPTEDVMLSSFTATSLMKVRGGKESDMTAADIMALWVRAQRNTSARLHLDHLWELALAPPRERMYQTTEPGREKTLRIQVENDDQRFIARFAGMSKRVQRLINNEAQLVDEIVEWAVTNQVLFTYSFVRNSIVHGDIHTGVNNDDNCRMGESSQFDAINMKGNNSKDARKRLGVDKWNTPSKRIRKEVVTVEDKQIMESCQSLVLRWFSCRNRKQVSVIFSTQVRNMTFPIYDELVKSLNLHCSGWIKAKMRLYDFGQMDRTLSRIERRCKGPTFKHSVLRLLKALEESLQEFDSDLTQIEMGTAIQDFERMCELFLDGKTPLEAATGLLSLDSSVQNTDLKTLLGWVPHPWIDRCHTCQGAFLTGTPIAMCDNCGHTVHPGCSSQYVIKIATIAQSFQPLLQVYAVRIPEACPRPDFRGRVTWTRLVIPAIRKKATNGSFAPMGMTLLATETAAAFLDELESGMLYSVFMKRRKHKYEAMKIDPIGTIVKSISQSWDMYTAKDMGIKRNDVIIGLSLDGINYTFSTLCNDDRLLLFKRFTQGSFHLDQLFLLRPNVNILEESLGWIRRVEKASQFLREAVDFRRELNICSACSTRVTSETILEQAKRCRAVIRRLGLESYSIPFHNESLDKSNDDRNHVSFRRLDRMMDFIIAKNDKVSQAGKDESIDSTLQRTPFMSPHLRSQERGIDLKVATLGLKRLNWAPERLENQPLTLLCHGMSILLTPAWVWEAKEGDKKIDHLQPERTALANHFISIFSAWCLGDASYMPTLTTAGPPSGAFFARQPWFEETCCICVMPIFEPLHNGMCNTCRQIKAYDPSCSEHDINAEAASINEDDHERDRFPLPIKECKLKTYDELASLVGKSVLVLPGDPVLDTVVTAVDRNVDIGGRPTTFIVVSYLPSHFEGGTSATSSECGVFHLFPVLSAQQLTQLIEKCKMQQPPDSAFLVTGYLWAKLDVLHEPGVLILKPSDLRLRLSKTLAMREAIDQTVAYFGKKSNEIRISNSGCLNCSIMPPLNFGISDPLSCKVIDADLKDMTGSLDPWDTKIEDFSGELKTLDRRSCTFEAKDTLAGAVCKNYKRLLDNLLMCEVPLLHDLTEYPDGSKDDEYDVISSGDNTASNSMDMHEVHSNKIVNRALPLALEGPLTGASYVPETLYDSNNNSLIPFCEEELLGHEHLPECRLVYCYVNTMSQDIRKQAYVQPARPWQHRDDMYTNAHSSTVTLSRNFRHEPFRMNGKVGGSSALGFDWGSKVIQHESEAHSFRFRRVLPSSLTVEAGSRMKNIICFVRGIGSDGTVRQSSLTAAFFGQSKTDKHKTARQGLKRLETRVTSPVFLAIDRDSVNEGVSHVIAVNPTVENFARFSQAFSRKAIFHFNLANGSENELAMTRHNRNISGAEIIQNPLIVPYHPVSDSDIGQQFIPCFINTNDLYISGLEGSHLTIVETAVTVFTQRLGLPNLAVRFLCPRYRWSVAASQCAVVQSADTLQIPRIRSEFWQHLLQQDSVRARIEQGDIIASDGPYQYRLPTIPIPLDREYEEFIRLSHDTESLSTVQIVNPFDSLIPRGTDTRERTRNETKRIRGGGPAVTKNVFSFQEPLEALTTLPRGCWMNRAVQCEVEVGDAAAIILGFVVDYNDETRVKIAVVHVSTLGMLQEQHFEFIHFSLLHLVKDGTEEAFLILEWRNQYDLEGEYSTSSGTVVEHHPSCLTTVVASQSDRHPEGQERHGSRPHSTLMIHAARSLIRRLCQSAKGPVIIGYFPDGRAVYWYAVDPGALFFQCHHKSSNGNVDIVENVQQSYCDRLGKLSSCHDVKDRHFLYPAPAGTFCCPWGCSCQQMGNLQRQVKFFTTIDDLMRHIQNYHWFGGINDNSLSINKILYRVGSGESICLIASHLASSICARCPSLRECATVFKCSDSGETSTPLDCQIIFDNDKFLDFSKRGGGTVAQIIRERLRDDVNTEQLCCLYSRVACLWDIQSDGHYRLSTIETSSRSRITAQIWNGRELNLQATCYMQSSQAAGSMDCTLCSRNEEAVLCVQNRSTGIGCSTLSGVCFPSKVCTQQTRGGCGQLRKVKSLLINLAKHIPESLRLESCDTFDLRMYLWEEQNYQSWYKLVESCTSRNHVLQALVSLLYSLKKAKMPHWWRASRGGWASAHAVMCLPSLSSVALYLYVLDAAVSEYESTVSLKAKIRSCPPQLEQLCETERMATIVEWGALVSMPLYGGSRGCLCAVCHRGGRLLSCEFCDMVQHSNCAQIVDSTKLKRWVCVSCSKDITELYLQSAK